MSYLLTIAVPTYNRERFLDRCLTAFIHQLQGLETEVELLISNNASSDNTEDVVNKHASKYPVSYYRNSENKGPDFNIASCFEKAKGKYVWVFGDDDFLLPNALGRILNVLRDNEFGVVHLKGVENNGEEVEKHSEVLDELKYDVYEDYTLFTNRVSFFVTFITGNIVNKSILPADFNYYEFMNTYLIQVSWIVSASFFAKQNAVIETPMVACEQDNSGGYNYIKVFAQNYNFILKSLVKKGVNKEIVSINNKSILYHHFPTWIHNILNKENSYEKNDGFLILIKCYWPYHSFWRRVFPIYLKHWAKNIANTL